MQNVARERSLASLYIKINNNDLNTYWFNIVEEEMNMNTRDDDEYGYVNNKHQYEMDKNNKDISRFVNQHQTDIKGLLMG